VRERWQEKQACREMSVVVVTSWARRRLICCSWYAGGRASTQLYQVSLPAKHPRQAPATAFLTAPFPASAHLRPDPHMHLTLYFARILHVLPEASRTVFLHQTPDVNGARTHRCRYPCANFKIAPCERQYLAILSPKQTRRPWRAAFTLTATHSVMKVRRGEYIKCMLLSVR
jgi:hypothetical protein